MNTPLGFIVLFFVCTSFNSHTELPTLQPLSNKDFKYISSKFGWRNHPIKNDYHFHAGIDIVAKNKQAPVYATADGYVTELDYSKEGLGLFLVIDHSNDIQTVYAHLSDIKVLKGTYVKAGQMIGKIGTTGGSTSEHLHYEIRFEGVALDPFEVIKRLRAVEE